MLNVWLRIVCLVAVAAVACTIVFGVGLGPPGPMQFVLVAGVSSHLAAVTRRSAPSFDVLADPRGFWLIVILALLQFSIEVVVARHYALALTFITPTALIISSAGSSGDPIALWRRAARGHAAWGCYSHGSSLDKRMGQTTPAFMRHRMILDS
jgi:fusaric acid resistance family protein